MIPQSNLDRLQAYLDGELSADDVAALETRLRTEPALAEALMTLAREEVVLAEWARVTGKTSQIVARLGAARRETAPVIRHRWWLGSVAAMLLVAVGLTYWWQTQQPVAPSPLAKLESVVGQVFVTQDKIQSGAKTGEQLFAGQGLRLLGDDSSATIVYSDGTRLQLDGDATISEFSGDQARGKRIKFDDGSLRADVAKQPLARPMILTTPNAEIVVLGTKFGLSGGNEATHVETEEGAVRLTRKSDGRSVEVPAGFEGIAALWAELGALPCPPRFRQPRFTTAGYYRTTALSPDGRTLITSRFGSGDIELWDAEHGLLRMTLAAHKTPISVAVLSLNGQMLATGSLDQTIKIWDLDTGGLLATLKSASDLQALAFADNDKTLVSLCGLPQQDKTLTPWDLITYQMREDPRTYPGRYLAFSPSGRTMAMMGRRSDDVILWDLPTGRERATINDLAGRPLTAALSPDDSLLALSDKNGRVMVWDILAARLRMTLRPAGQSVQGLAFSPDGRRLAMGQRFGTVRFWEIASGKQEAILESPIKPGSTATVRPMIFSSNGKTMATTESLDDGTVRLWDLPGQ